MESNLKSNRNTGLIISVIFLLIFLGGLVYYYTEYKELKIDNKDCNTKLKNNECNKDFGKYYHYPFSLSTYELSNTFITFKDSEDSENPLGFDPYLYFGNFTEDEDNIIGPVTNEQGEKLSIYLVVVPLESTNINGILLFDDNKKIYIINQEDVEYIEEFKSDSKLTAKLYNNNTVKSLSVVEEYIEPYEDEGEEYDTGYYDTIGSLNISYTNNDLESIRVFHYVMNRDRLNDC